MTLVASVRAELPVVSSGETVLFSDDFADNRNRWTNIVATDLSARGAVTDARIVNSLWSPAEPGGESIKSTVESVYTFAQPVELSSGPVSIYLVARVDEARGGDGNRFGISMTEAKRASFACLVVRPGLNATLDYRNDLGKAQSAKLGAVRFTEGRFEQFKLTINASWNVDGFIGRAEAFVYDKSLRQYVPLGVVDEAMHFKTGRLEQLMIVCRNGVTGFAYIDSVAVTQPAR